MFRVCRFVGVWSVFPQVQSMVKLCVYRMCGSSETAAIDYPNCELPSNVALILTTGVDAIASTFPEL
jgi:hypothetical protein